MSLDEVTIAIMSFFVALQVVSAEPIVSVNQAKAEMVARAVFDSDGLVHGRCTKKAFVCWTSDRVAEAHDEAGAGNMKDMHTKHVVDVFTQFEPA